MRTFAFTAKCSDMFFAHLWEDHKELGKEYEGYVPKFFPERGGDYIRFEIDLDTGQIVNWNKPDQEDLDELFQLKGEDEV